MAFRGYLKASTAVAIKVGPFVDDADGVTAMTALTISQADVRLSKNGGNMAQKNESTALAHDEIGMYDCLLDATDTNTAGILTLNVSESGALPVRQEYAVLVANVYDSLIAGSAVLAVNASQISGSATPADNIETAFASTLAEASAVPAANAPIWTKLNFMFAKARNKITQTATTQLVRNDADSGTIATSTVSDDGTTATRGEYV